MLYIPKWWLCRSMRRSVPPCKSQRGGAGRGGASAADAADRKRWRRSTTGALAQATRAAGSSRGAAVYLMIRILTNLLVQRDVRIAREVLGYHAADEERGEATGCDEREHLRVEAYNKPPGTCCQASCGRAGSMQGVTAGSIHILRAVMPRGISEKPAAASCHPATGRQQGS